MDMEHRPHDSIFRALFSDAAGMTELLQLVLPPDLLSQIDMATLKLEPDSYLDDSGGRHYADLAATVEISNVEFSLYILFEHKSYPDSFAHLQILSYMVQTWLRDSREVKSSQAGLPLRPVLPILFYHGSEREIPERFSEAMFSPDLSPEILRYQPDFAVSVFNLSTLPDDRIAGPLDLQAALFAMKYVRRDFSLLLRELNRLAQSGGVLLIRNPRFKLIELYLLYAAGLTQDELKRRIEEEVTDPVLQEDFMSTAQMLKMEGRQEGLQEGLQKGRQEARVEGILKVARNLEGTMPLEEIARVVELPVEELRRLLEEQEG